MLLNYNLILEIQDLLKIFMSFIFFSFILIIIYYIFLQNNIFIDNNDIKNENNLKSYILLIISLVCLFFILFTIGLNLYLFNIYYYGHLYIEIMPKMNIIDVDFFTEYTNNLFSFSINKFNLIFFLLFCILYPIIFVIMSYDYNNNNIKMYFYFFVIFILSFLLLLIENIILFYFVYELLLIIVFFLMYHTANSRGGVEAALFFMGWAILGSILVGLGFIILIILTSNTTFTSLKINKLTANEIYYIYLLFFLGFGVKLSVWPFWYWLPKAHVEVSTGMSIFLSCILIKLSLFCLLRVQHTLLTEISYNISIFISFLCVIDVVFRFINVKDLKAIVAYSSVLHTNLLLVLIHLDSFKILNSIVFYIWGHSLATTSLFIIINVIESRYSSRNIIYISGLWYTSPFLGYLTFFSLLPFLDLPISIFFWGELWLWVVALDQLFIITFQVLFLVNVVFVSIFFKMWWCVLFGTPDVSIKKINSVELNYDINLILLWLNSIQIILGVQPAILNSICGIYI